MDDETIKTYEEVVEEIDNISKLDNLNIETIEDIMFDISNLEEKQRQELYERLVEQLKAYVTYIYNTNKDVEEVENLVSDFTSTMTKYDTQSLVAISNGNFSIEEIKEELNIKEEEQEEKDNNPQTPEETTQPIDENDLEQVEKRINELDAKYLNILVNNYLKHYTTKLQQINSDISKLKTNGQDNQEEIASLESELESIKSTISALEEPNPEQQKEAVAKIFSKNEPITYDEVLSIVLEATNRNIELINEDLTRDRKILEKLDKSISDLKDKIISEQDELNSLGNNYITNQTITTDEIEIEEITRELDNRKEEEKSKKYASFTLSELEGKKIDLEENKKFLLDQSSRYAVLKSDFERIDELDLEISEITREIEKRKEKEENNKEENISDADLRNELSELEEELSLMWVDEQSRAMDYEAKGKIEARIKEIKEELSKRENNRYQNLSDTQLKELLTDLENKKAYLWSQGEYQTASNTEIEAIEKEIETLRNELESRNQKTSKYGNISTEELKQRLEELKNKPKTMSSNEDLRKEKAKSINDKKQKLEKLEKERKEILDSIKYEEDSLSQTQTRKAELEELERLKKLKQERKIDVNDLDDDIDPVVEATENKEFWKKALAASAGFVAGMGMSCVPGVGTIRMTVATAKIASSAINVWTKKHPNGVVAKTMNKIDDKLHEKFPRIMEGLETMRSKLKQTPLNCFINGVAAGYLVGNVIEAITGETVLQHLMPEDVDAKGAITSGLPKEVPDASPNPELPTGGLEETQIIPTPPTPMIPQPGEVYDLSGLTEGLVSSDATSAVDIMSEVGKAVEFDKAVTLPSGEVMWHFKQLNGAGYAWFNSKDVMEVLSKQAQSAVSNTLQ